MSDLDLKRRVASLAMEYPKGSETRQKLMNVLAAAYEDYVTEGGTPFQMRTPDFARFLQDQMGIRPGVPMGSYLRGEEKVPDSMAGRLKEMGAQIRLGPERKKRDWWDVPEKGPDINRLWDSLVSAIWKQLQPYGADAGDYFVNMPREYGVEDFDQYLQTVAGDISLNWEYDLKGAAEKWYDKFALALKTGIYKGHLDPQQKARYKTILGEIYADAWYDAMSKGWERIKRNPTEIARLQAMRPSR